MDDLALRHRTVIQTIDLPDGVHLMLALDNEGDVAEAMATRRVTFHNLDAYCTIPLGTKARSHKWRTAGSNSYGYLLDYQVCLNCDVCSEEDYDPACRPVIHALLDHAAAVNRDDAIPSHLATMAPSLGL